jgi:hypothetical protein
MHARYLLFNFFSMKTQKNLILFLSILLSVISSCTQTVSDKLPKDDDAPSMVAVMDLLTNQFDSSGNLRQDENPVGNIVFDFCFNFVYPLELSYSNGNTKEVQSLENLVFVLIADSSEEQPVNGIVFPFSVEVFNSQSAAIEVVSIQDVDEFESLVENCDFENDLYCIEIYAPVCVKVSDLAGDAFVITYPNACYAGLDGFTEDDFIEDCKDGTKKGDLFDRKCFELDFPLTIMTGSGESIPLESELELEKTIYELYHWEYQFPISITKEDGTEQILESTESLNALLEECYGDYWKSNCMCTKEYNPTCIQITDPLNPEKTYTKVFSNPCEAICAGFKEEDFVECPSTDVEENYKLWESAEIKSYSFDLMVSCFCTIQEPYQIRVINGKVEQIKGNETWGSEGIPTTVDALFDTILKKLKQTPFQYNLEFDSEYGYPTDVSFDMVEMIADEEIGYSISNFKIL